MLFLDQAVLELLNSDRVHMVNEQPSVVNHLSVSVQPWGKKRLILDLCHVSVKYEDWKNCYVLLCEGHVHVFLQFKKWLSS